MKVEGYPALRSAGDGSGLAEAALFDSDETLWIISALYGAAESETASKPRIGETDGLAFTDDLPPGVVVTAAPNPSQTCSGGTLTAAAGATSISYSGGTVPAGASCTVSVDVTSSTAGDHVNTSGALTSIAGDSGTAMATLTVNPAFGVDVDPQSPDSDQQVGTSADYTFRVTNTGSNADIYDLAGSGLYFDVSTATTAMLPQAAFEDVTVTAVVPCGATLGVAEALSLSATSQTMGAVMDSDSLDVTPFDVNTGSGGGYFFANSLATCAASMPAFNWIDVSATGTDVVAALDDDNLIGPVSIGFSFTFFGNTYTYLYISSNGWISFDGSDPGTLANRDNTTLPAPSLPNDLIAVFWDDMDPDDRVAPWRQVGPDRWPKGFCVPNVLQRCAMTSILTRILVEVDMGQVTLYLDSETEKKMKAAAGAAGVSNSRWVRGLIREKTADEWPQSIVELAGSWPDMPSLEEIRSDEGDDVPREPL